jgi:4-diphosphocytidyl-2-C-methyl-D-erythritol kinase
MSILRAKAKINLFFQIIGKRLDGYHLIESLVVFAEDICDTIKITESDSNKTFVTGGLFAHNLMHEKNNLIDKALDYFSLDKKYHCYLTKNIPIGAGLGGGSSDAAVVAKFLQDNLSHEQLIKIGADLPICYHAEPVFCSGIGEIIEPIYKLPKLYMLLVNPNKPLLTKDVFVNNKKIDSIAITSKPIDFASDIDKLLDFIAPLENDLTASAIQLMPEISEILILLAQQKGCLLSRMSGSGPTCFALFENKMLAASAMNYISEQNPHYWVKHTSI